MPERLAPLEVEGEPDNGIDLPHRFYREGREAVDEIGAIDRLELGYVDDREFRQPRFIHGKSDIANRLYSVVKATNYGFTASGRTVLCRITS